jgi:hypothetical protein
MSYQPYRLGKIPAPAMKLFPFIARLVLNRETSWAMLARKVALTLPSTSRGVKNGESNARRQRHHGRRGCGHRAPLAFVAAVSASSESR